ncbi:MAG: hypothetical protein H7A37_00780 [Chlamydiales bacterium]|nr:hypothetical protein [Chlamydiia bacterium]MCP5506827.1 hypothetical protein [Chlamydiales bacterium]
MLWTWFRRLVMIGIPLILVWLEWDHPSGFSKNVYEGLSPLDDWWMWLHIFQSFLFGGMAVAAVLLTLNINDFWGIASKLAAWLFAVCYLVFDSTAGISVGLMIVTIQQDPSMDLPTMQKMLQAAYLNPIVGGSGSFFSMTGSWAWLVAVATAIVAIFLHSKEIPLWKRLPPLVLLAVSGYVLYVGHYSPYGPIAFSCFAAASIWFEMFRFGPAQ